MKSTTFQHSKSYRSSKPCKLKTRLKVAPNMAKPIGIKDLGSRRWVTEKYTITNLFVGGQYKMIYRIIYILCDNMCNGLLLRLLGGVCFLKNHVSSFMLTMAMSYNRRFWCCRINVYTSWYMLCIKQQIYGLGTSVLIKQLQLGAICPQAIVYCYLVFKPRYALFKSIFLKNRSLSNAMWFYGKNPQTWEGKSVWRQGLCHRGRPSRFQKKKKKKEKSENMK